MDQSTLISSILDYADTRNAASYPIATHVPGLTIVRSRMPTDMRAGLMSPLFCMVLSGRKETWTGETPVQYGAGDGIVVSMTLPVRSRIVSADRNAPYVAMAVEIDLGLIRELDLEIEQSSETLASHRVIERGKVGQKLQNAMTRLFELNFADPTERDVMRPLLMREIHFRLLTSGEAGFLRELSQKDSRSFRINTALQCIKNRFRDKVPIRELAELAGMSVSTFHDQFKRLTGTSPLQYQKDLQLLEARNQLLDGKKSVALIAYNVGYDSPTQFSREYSRKFGHAPSQERYSA